LDTIPLIVSAPVAQALPELNITPSGAQRFALEVDENQAGSAAVGNPNMDRIALWVGRIASHPRFDNEGKSVTPFWVWQLETRVLIAK
jgi:hypothetical protein